MTVYAVQQQMKLNQQSGQLAPRFDSIEKAAKWGKIVYLLPPSAHPFAVEVTLGSLHEHLSGFNDDDFLLLIGNPTLIGMATAIAAHYNEGRVRFLQWSGKHREYSEISSKIY